MKTLTQFKAELRKDGYTNLLVREDAAGMFYANHAHPAKSAHVILEGGLVLTVGGERHHLKPGDRLDVPANAVHSAKIGPTGCRYLIGG